MVPLGGGGGGGGMPGGPPGMQFSGGPRNAGQFIPCKNLWIGNLSEECSEDDLRREFGAFGNIEHIKLLSMKNCAFVNYSAVDEALRARNALQGHMIYGRPIRINFGRVRLSVPLSHSHALQHYFTDETKQTSSH